jgi:hypothetical protein
MPGSKECPLSGATLRRKEHHTIIRLPGNPNATSRVSREWVCPDCDYYEEDDGEGV